MASPNPAPQASPPAPESPWMPFIKEAFPNLDTEAYFVPPVHFNKVPFDVNVVAGQTTQGLIPPAHTPADLPARPQNPPPPPPAGPEPQVAGTVFTDNPQGLIPSRVQESDAQDDKAQSHCLECLKMLAETRKEVMMVVSQLKFKKYLDKTTDHVHAAATALPPGTQHLQKPLVDGECDIIILHPQYGIIVGEIKSVGGSQGGVSVKSSTIVTRVEKAVKQLNNQSKTLTRLVNDLGVKVTKVLILPNVTATELTQALQTVNGLMQDLCKCLGGKDLSATLTKCLCKDSMPDPQLLRLRSTAPPRLSRWALLRYAVFHQLHSRLQSAARSNAGNSSSPAGTMATLCSWWEGVVKGGRDVPDEVYPRLVARFCGPATTIEIPMATPPRKEIRTHGEAVAETGLRISRLALYPRQVDLLNTPLPRCVYLLGPPGTGKTIILLLKALQWLKSGKHVHLLSTRPVSHAITAVLHGQILASGTSADAVHCHYYDQVDGADECEARTRLTEDATACCGPDVCVVLDEVDIRNKNHIAFLKKIVDMLPRATVWAAGMYDSSSSPIPYSSLSWLHVETLTDPLRCPPAVHRLVAESKVTRSICPPYTLPPVPPVTEGLEVRWLKHRGRPGHTSGSCQDCAACGELIAEVLRELHVGEPGKLQYRDVFIFTKKPLDNTPMVLELRSQGILVNVMRLDDPQPDIGNMALAKADQVVVTDYATASGLERRLVFGLENDSNSRLFGMSRCSGQLYWFDQ